MADRYGPYRNSRFRLVIDSITIAGFSECTMPDNTTEPIEYREGNDDLATVKKLWSLNKYGTLTLKRGTTDDSLQLFEWRKLVEQGHMENARRNISLVIRDEQGKDGPTWSFKKAWPSKYDMPDFNATGSEVAIETLEIVHEGMSRTA